MKKSQKGRRVELYMVGLAFVLSVSVGVITIYSQQNQVNAVADTPTTRQSREAEDNLFRHVITKEKLQQKLKDGEELYVMFFSPTCGYCQKAAPLAYPAAESKKITLFSVNVGADETLFDAYSIAGTPTIVHFQGGKEKDRLEKLRSREVYENYFEAGL